MPYLHGRGCRLWFNVAGMPFALNAGPYAVALKWALFIFGFIFVRTMELFLHRPPWTVIGVGIPISCAVMVYPGRLHLLL